MKLWRLGKRLIATRFLPAIGSALPTLLLIVSTAAAVAYIYVNQRAAATGISDWSVRVAELSQQRVIIDRLSLTLTQPAQASTNSSQPPTLGTLLATSYRPGCRNTSPSARCTLTALPSAQSVLSQRGCNGPQEQQQVTLKANLTHRKKPLLSLNVRESASICRLNMISSTAT